MNSDQILEHFRQTDALLEGHFILSSGLHSPTYLQCALALQYPADASKFGHAIADELVRGCSTAGPGAFHVDTVASPAIGGLVIGYATADALNTRFIWTERDNSVMTLRRGFTVEPGQRVLVVEDVITTGGSTRECIEALKNQGADVVAAASIIDRSNGKADVGVPRISLVTLDVPLYRPEDCPMCANSEEAVKPGSRSSR
jgi:orotate phosphoribosyltransferase